MKSINEQLIEWAEKYVPKFNKLSQLYQTPYYTQSPLNVIEEEVDTMIVGINPKGKLGTGESIFENPKKYLEGNPTWSSRFQKDGSISPDWGKSIGFYQELIFFLDMTISSIQKVLIMTRRRSGQISLLLSQIMATMTFVEN